MSEGQELAPVIIKKIKKGGGHGHHGGAWKVAYADFVTAMMAFFLLMWLLNATTEVQRKGIADYFHPTIPVNRISGGGDGAFGGDSIMTEDNQIQSGTGASNRFPAERVASQGDTGFEKSASEDGSDESGQDEEKEQFETLEEMLTGKAGESMASEDIARHIVTKITDEGLIVELFDLPGEPLFAPGTTSPTPIMEALIDMVAGIFRLAENNVAVNAFTSSLPIVVADNPVWDISTGRAEIVRQRLEGGQLPEGRTERVTGYADRKPVVRNPMSARNSRIEIILLREVK
ncbi:Flagellar motor rotation protein MotB [Candidatus Rhodobacter oscarellae]|uniref:Flagellar motor rotation protein MotB n=1 Tax=Candidatus Rhodobacter oscarellae TaxID=1675527 RepID=A0A0J9EBL2_9RHOB|nr:flagellar motor protein MotB [Candidatus Rhodobacter lobularis]KMW60036.1 Flagellar motor rotation protein MotB [Candidatus Rhodobacter lobularis]